MDNLDIGNGAKVFFEISLFDGKIKIDVTQTWFTILAVTLIVIFLALWLAKDLKKRPTKKQVVAEKIVNMLYNLVESTMGKHNLKFAPYIGTLFISLILGSLLGMTQIFRSSTADLMTLMGYALVTTGICWYQGIKNNGFFKWLKGFSEPIAFMTPMNIISEIAQPVSMAFRHFGNVVGGNVLMSIIYAALASATYGIFSWLPAEILSWFPPILDAGLPAILSIYFDLFSGFVQAFVFSLLTMVYVGSNTINPAENNK